jgi:hypothetical protein
MPMHFNGRLRLAAKLQFHCEYGAYIPAMMKSEAKLKEMQLTPEEEVKVGLIVEWMATHLKERDWRF